MFQIIKNIYNKIFKNNNIYIVDKDGKRKNKYYIRGLSICFKGKNIEIILNNPYKLRFSNTKIIMANKSKLIIKKPKYKFKNFSIFLYSDNGYVEIGEEFYTNINSRLILNAEPNLKIIIGDNCMFGSNVEVRASDAHSILCNKTNKVLNFGKNVTIGNHCWLAKNVSILKGVNIADNSVVGYGSVVVKDCGISNSIYAGNPAKLVKTDINWSREIPSEKIGAN